MNIISCDVGWKTGGKRNAVAVATEDWKITYLRKGLDDDQLISLVCELAEPKSLILLDIPIEGCVKLKGPRRPIEDALQHYISLYPASMACKMAPDRGKQLKEKLLKSMDSEVKRSVIIKEVYPHAVYKFLWFAKEKGKLAKLQKGEWQNLLDESFRLSKSVPPSYKRKTKGERLKGMNELYDFLNGYPGLIFVKSLDPPNSCYTCSDLELLADQYDACLGAIVGLYCVTSNPFALIAGDMYQGEMLLFADRWLKERLEESRISMKHLF